MFRQWADRTDTQMIIESTYDPNSSIAKAARDPEGRVKVYEEDKDKEDKDKDRFYNDEVLFY